MNRFADVALPVAVDREFTYLIPLDLQKTAMVGARVVVPFGRKYATGLIVGFPSVSSVKSLRHITDIIDPEPVVLEELLRLCRWMSDYYLTPLGEILKAALPHGFAPPSRRQVRIGPSSSANVMALLSTRAPKRAQILRFLIEGGTLSSSELQKRSGLKNINAVLNEMAREGYLLIEEVMQHPKGERKKKEFVLLDVLDTLRLAAFAREISPRRKRLHRLLASLALLTGQHVREIPVRDLLKSSGSSSAILRELSSHHLLKIEAREVTGQEEFGIEEETLHIVLNADQQKALAAITEALVSADQKTFLLHGITGSGKTQVYIEAIRRCLNLGKDAIVLVPEISLTPQTVRRFRSHFGEKVAVVHSRMSTGERQEVWRLASRGDYRVVIGPRSAVFAPLRKPGLIVVDEEHESSYKQFDSSPRYHARDVAIMRGTLAGATVVLGSATPSAESYYNTTAGKHVLLEMPRRVDAAVLPEITIVDMASERKHAYSTLKESLTEDQRKMLKEFREPIISSLLKSKIADRLSRHEGIILLQNRRGYAPFADCPECGYIEMCDNCNVTMTYHLAKKHLRCHYCGLIRQLPATCPGCRGATLELRGAGTQRVEREIEQLFPGTKILRMDRDTTSGKGAHQKLLSEFGRGEANILLGTQMVAKGLDFARVTLVGVISADTQMLLPDFRASERTFQLLTQVAGRAGRSTLSGEVIIQTHQPGHPTLCHVVDHDFKAFYEMELASRRELDYPPFSRIILVETKGGDEERVRLEAEKFARILREHGGVFAILGPAPAVIERINNQYRWHIVIKNLKTADPSGIVCRTEVRNALQRYGRQSSRNVRVIIDVDPVGLL